MIESKNDAGGNLEKVLQILEQAKQRVADEKKKQNEKKCKTENPLSPMPKMEERVVWNDGIQSLQREKEI